MYNNPVYPLLQLPLFVKGQRKFYTQQHIAIESNDKTDGSDHKKDAPYNIFELKFCGQSSTRLNSHQCVCARVHGCASIYNTKIVQGKNIYTSKQYNNNNSCSKRTF